MPVDNRGLFDELQLGIRVLPEHHLGECQRVERPLEGRLLALGALDNKTHHAALFRERFHDKARVAVRKPVQDNGAGFDHLVFRERGPAHDLTAEHVQVNVEHRLAGIGLAVEYETCAGFFDAEFLRDNLCTVEHLAHQFAVGRLHVHDGRNVALGHYQKVHRGLRGDVVEGEHVVVFVDFLGRDFTLDDFAEKTVFTHSDYKVVKRKAARFLGGWKGEWAVGRNSNCRGLFQSKNRLLDAS